MGLYILYMINVRENAAFSHFETIPDALLGLIIVTALFLFVYLIWFFITFCITCIYFKDLPFRSRILYLYSLAMLFVCVGTVIFGVYSPFYQSGGIFLFFIALFNLYVWSLVYLNWPV